MATTRPATREKYMGVVRELRRTLQTTNHIEANMFALTNKVSNHLLTDLEKVGFITRHGHETTWNDWPINEETMEPIFARMQRRNQAIRDARRDAVDAYNQYSEKQPEPVSEPGMTFLLEEPTTTSEVPQQSEQQYEQQIKELSQRVAAMEQLIIRRGIA